LYIYKQTKITQNKYAIAGRAVLKQKLNTLNNYSAL